MHLISALSTSEGKRAARDKLRSSHVWLSEVLTINDEREPSCRDQNMGQDSSLLAPDIVLTSKSDLTVIFSVGLDLRGKQIRRRLTKISI